MNAQLWFMMAGILITAIINIVILTKYISTIKLAVEANFTKALQVLKKELEEKDDTLRHEVAETLKPIQIHIARYEEKHYKLELYIRDNYIEVDTFRNAIEEIKDLVRGIAGKVDKMNDDSVNWRREKK